MNNNRLSTNKNSLINSIPEDLDLKIKNLLDSSNLEVHENGKIFIKSSQTYLKGRGSVGVNVLNTHGEVVFKFNSIKDCALFFNVHTRTINRRLENGSLVEYNNQNLVFQREIHLP